MEVDEAKDSRKSLEAIIAKRLRDYEKETGLSVKGISVMTSAVMGHRNTEVISVEIEAEL